MPLTDYFRAAGPDVAARVLDRVGGPLVGDVPPGEPTLDGLSAKNVDPDVVLGQLVAFVRDEPWDPETVDIELLRPEETSETEGPWLVALDDATRDTLAGVAGDRIPELAARWAAIEEFRGRVAPEHLRELLGEFVGLARRAVADGDQLYCWMCL
jgi:hypothetical protein